MKTLSLLLLQRMSQPSSYKHEKYCWIHRWISQYLIYLSLCFWNYFLFFEFNLATSVSAFESTQDSIQHLCSYCDFDSDTWNIFTFLTPEVLVRGFSSILFVLSIQKTMMIEALDAFLGFSVKNTMMHESLPVSSCFWCPFIS